MAKTAADLLIERLIDWGVDTLFGFPGDGINGIFEALRTRQDKIRFIQVRHEEAAAFAACGYAKYTGRLGVCLATSGPGGIHLLNGLYDAKSDGQPAVAITGHTFHDLIGTHYQQDVDLDKLYMDVAAYNERIMGPAHVCNVVDEAIRTALSEQTVAHVTIPKDIQEWDGSDVPRSKANIAGHSADLSPAALPLPPQGQLQAAADLLNAGKKVAILAGRGCLGARSEILEISFPYIEFYPKPGRAKCVQIDASATRIGLRYPVDVGLVGDCRRILDTLLPLVQRKESRGFLEKAQERMRKWNELLHTRAELSDRPMKPAVVAYHINKLLADDAIVTTDCGTVTTYAARYLQMRDGMKFSSSGMLATMGNSLPYSVAAAVAYPGHQIVCFSGDGGFTMMMGEPLTMVKYKLPVKIVVLKNNVLCQIKWEQMVFEGNPQFGVELQPLDFALYAKACGANGFTLDDPDNAADVLRAAFESDGPAVVQAVIDPNEPALPGHVTLDQAWHFAESLARGEKDRWAIIKDVLKETVREVV
jgi:pyruvate dehydrogenase (quinone)